MVFEPVITFFKGLVPKGFHFCKWENNFKGIIIGEKLGKHLVRQQHGSCVLILFQGLELGVFTWNFFKFKGGWHVQAFAEGCHEIPVYVTRVKPMGTHFAILTSSSCCATSRSALSASHLMVVPHTFPWHHKDSKAVANALPTVFEGTFFGTCKAFSR